MRNFELTARILRSIVRFVCGVVRWKRAELHIIVMLLDLKTVQQFLQEIENTEASRQHRGSHENFRTTNGF